MTPVNSWETVDGVATYIRLKPNSWTVAANEDSFDRLEDAGLVGCTFNLGLRQTNQLVHEAIGTDMRIRRSQVKYTVGDLPLSIQRTDGVWRFFWGAGSLLEAGQFDVISSVIGQRFKTRKAALEALYESLNGIGVQGTPLRSPAEHTFR